MGPFKFCPYCKTPLKQVQEGAYCARCDWTFYNNPRVAAGILPIDIKAGKVLVAYRAIDPLKGEIDVIGGFTNPYELPEQTAAREAKEETNAEVRPTELLGIYTDTYGSDGSPLLVFHYIGIIESGTPKPSDDVAKLEWVEINKLPTNRGFKNTQEAFRDLKRWYQNHKMSNK